MKNFLWACGQGGPSRGNWQQFYTWWEQFSPISYMLWLNHVKCLLHLLQTSVVLTRGSAHLRPRALKLCRDGGKGSSFGSDHPNLMLDTSPMLLDLSEVGFAHLMLRTITVTPTVEVLVVSGITFVKNPGKHSVGTKFTAHSFPQLATGNSR